MVVHADDLFAEGRAEALLHVDEHLRNMLRINFVSFAITCGTDGWTWTGDPAHSKEPGRELKVGGPKGAATPANDPHSEDDLTSQKAERDRSLAGRLLYHSIDDSRVQFDTGLVMRGMSTPKVLGRGEDTPSGALHRGGPWCGLAVSWAGRRRNVEALRPGGSRSRSRRRE